ncbi:MAG TPA: Lpg1974 family pore-forming outer membrane protein [Rhizomicrobium sp.]|nr:Lpg1974 family pore-forming outer membrane protein [Rhizomicrobium sp.]
MALTVYISSAGVATAEDTSRPLIWIELGTEFTGLQSANEPYLPPFVLPPFYLGASRASFITESPADLQKNAPSTWDENAKITFEPKGTRWDLSLGIVYGRSSHHKSLRQQTANRFLTSSGYPGFGYAAYQKTVARNPETHLILDFQAGKDVGLGVFGHEGLSRISLGLRYAQFNSRDNADIHYQPTNSRYAYQLFHGSFQAKRHFIGVGPSLSWEGSAGLAGNTEDGGLSVDWSVNGAVLFGRQRVRGHHQTTQISVTYPSASGKHVVYQSPAAISRSKQVVVPNLGGSAGFSWHYANAKMTLGYRADFFFNAIDGGIDARKSENRAFYGPYASISIGIGD